MVIMSKHFWYHCIFFSLSLMLLPNQLYARDFFNIFKQHVPDVDPKIAAQVEAATQNYSMPSLPEDFQGSFTINLQINDNTQNTSVEGMMPSAFEDYKKWFTSGKEKVKYGFSSLLSYIANNKKASCFYFLGGSYVALHSYLLYLKYQLNKESCWSLWEKGKSVEDLYQIPQHILAQQLLSYVQQTYTTTDDPTDFVSPFTKFMKDTEQERKYLQRYKTIAKAIDHFYIRRIFFLDKTLVKKIPGRLNRLAYIRSTFLSWLADVKVNQAQESSGPLLALKRK